MISLKKLLNWTFYTDNLIKLLKILNETFEQIKITEYLENNYTIEIPKKSEISIGKVFGILEEQV